MHANKMRKLVVRESHIGIIREQDTEFGEVEVTPTIPNVDETLPSQGIDRSRLSHLSFKQQEKLLSLLDEYKDCFSEHPGFCDVVEHEITVTPDFKPRRCNACKVPELLKIETERQVANLLKLGFIIPSMSPMASAVVCVIKPDKSVRLTYDFRYVNQYTIGDCQPMPNLTDSMHRVASAKYVTLCDAKSGFWQLNVKKEHRWLTSFVTHHGQWEWIRMPFGFRCASNIFVRAVQPIKSFCDSYVDDMSVLSGRYNVHVNEHWRGFLEVIRRSGLTLNLFNCKFAATGVIYVGHLVGGGRHRSDSAKLEAMMSIRYPQTKEFRQALGALGFYTADIEGYAGLCKVLTDMTDKNKPNKLTWGTKEQNCFDKLKLKVCSVPMLMTPQYGKPFLLYTDASLIAVGCCLAQINESNEEHPIAYGSKKLSTTTLHGLLSNVKLMQ